MERTLRKKFGFQAELQVSETTMFENQPFYRVVSEHMSTFRVSILISATQGGLECSEDFIQWKSGLAQSASWAVTRTLRVVPAINLFDEETQKKIWATNYQASSFKLYVYGALRYLGSTVRAGINRAQLRAHSLYNDEKLRAKIPLIINVVCTIVTSVVRCLFVYKILVIPFPPGL